MKPRMLNLTAFGPFASSETVDFTRLPSDALFLIHGPTGAGKTSLLDGICYALYGVTSGEERKAKEMRSQHAADNVVTQIEFEFDLGARRFKVRRTPEYERAKQRSGKDGDSKTITESAKAELSELIDEAWVSLSSKSTDVTENVERLIGFKADQFRQVIMLPQGKFRDFLSADSKARESILETLFSTAIYKQVQDRLRDSARELEIHAKTANTQRDEVLKLSEVENVTALDLRIQQSSADLVALDEKSKTIEMEELAAKTNLTQGEALSGHFKEHTDASEALKQHLAAGPVVSEKQVKLNLAAKAQQVMPTFDIVKEARHRVVEQVAKSELAANQLATAETNNQTAQASLLAETNRQQQRDDATKAVTHLDGLRDTVSKLNESETAWFTAQRLALLSKQAFEKSDQALKQNQTNREQLTQQMTETNVVAAKFDALNMRKTQLASVKKILGEVAEAQTQMKIFALKEDAAKNKAELAKVACDKAVELKRNLDLIWRQGQAFVLAKHLDNGSPCPVCGSHEHPHPAQDEIDIPSDEDLALAEQVIKTTGEAFEAARAAFELAAKNHVAKKTAYEVGQASLSQFNADDAQQIDARIADNQQQLDAAATAQVLLVTIKGKLEREDTQFKVLSDSLNTCRSEADKARTQEASALATYQERQKTVPEQYRVAHALEEAIKSASDLRDSLNKAFKIAQDDATNSLAKRAAAAADDKSAKDLLQSLETRKAQAETALAQILQANEIADEQALMSQRLSRAEMDDLQEQIKVYQQAVGTAQERVARAKTNILNQQPPDVTALKTLVDEVRLKSDSLIAERESKRKILLSDDKAKKAIDDINLRLGDIEKQYSILGHLSEIANGKNGRNLTFQRYVLAALLDQVLIQASLRLRVMSHSRYTLQRREDVTDGRRASGLDLDVFDDYTGKSRPASTLSGGEGFMAALALALGLSDVVQSYAGGIQLDTLFIDEGFGSLDPESLDTALKTLIDLRQSGRMVGIISHVEDLKRQIDVGIEIKSGIKGSEVNIFGGATAL